MSLHHLAQHMAKYGRGPDTELIHMTKGEIASLQSLAKAHGGSLTINPHTGLVEAGFLSKLLPMIAGAALASTGIGAFGAGALLGGGTALATGDLKKGLMAGLGAYGGYGLADGAMAAAAPETAAPATEAVAAPATPPAAPTSAAQTGFTATPADPSVANMSPDQYAAQANNPFGSAPFEPRPGVTPENYGQNFSGTSTVNSLKPEVSGFDRVAQNFKADPKLGLAAIAPAMVADPMKLPEPEKYDGPLSRYRMSEDYRPYLPQQPNPYYQARMYNYAGGGPVEQMSNANAIGANTGYPQADIMGHAYATPWQTPVSGNVVTGAADTGVNRMTGEQTFAGGGIASLGGYSDGGRMLKGPGDGMSDSIPATINGKQPARLANDEFVVPADVVSHLGNGSSDAGAKQLYNMMDRIRQQRTGKKKQAPRVDALKAMPA